VGEALDDGPRFFNGIPKRGPNLLRDLLGNYSGFSIPESQSFCLVFACLGNAGYSVADAFSTF